MKIYDNLKGIKNSAWSQKHACQISVEYNENWSSYQGLKLWKKALFICNVPWFFPLHDFSHIFDSFLDNDD